MWETTHSSYFGKKFNQKGDCSYGKTHEYKHAMKENVGDYPFWLLREKVQPKGETGGLTSISMP